MKEYDIIVIGTGGGTKLVTPPSKIGYKIAVIEKKIQAAPASIEDVFLLRC